MDRRTTICIWVILVGLANFLAYTVVYMFLGGEAVSGYIEKTGDHLVYKLHWGQAVSKGVFLYSGIHSISIWLTVAAIMLAMLTLAKERIVSSMRSTIIRGRTFITILATIIALMTIMSTVWFTLQFVDRFRNPIVTPTDRAITVPGHPPVSHPAQGSASVNATHS